MREDSTDDAQTVRVGDEPGTDLELLVKEYERVATESAAYKKSVFADFQSLAAIGAIIAWGPLSSSVVGAVLGDAAESDKVVVNCIGLTNDGLGLFLGFLAILIVVSAIGIRDAVKAGVIVYHNDYLTELEGQLEKRLGPFAPHGAVKWRQWHREVHGPQQRMFRRFIGAVVLLLPSTVFCLVGAPVLIALYGLSYAVCLWLLIHVARRIPNRVG